jgi:hypothetical protein
MALTILRAGSMSQGLHVVMMSKYPGELSVDDSSEAPVAVKRASGTSRSGSKSSLKDSQLELTLLCFALL